MGIRRATSTAAKNASTKLSNKPRTALRFSDMDADESGDTSTAGPGRVIIKRTPSLIKKNIAEIDPRLSPQQRAVIEWVINGEGSSFVEAVAGSGKTFTLVEACKFMQGSVALAAFNKKISEEIKYKTAALANVKVGTFHSFGFNAWRRLYPRVRVDEYQKRRQTQEECRIDKSIQAAVAKLVGLAKQSVVGVAWNTDEMDMWAAMIERHDVLLAVEGNGGYKSEAELIAGLVEHSVNSLALAQELGPHLIDYNDMIWLPLLEDVSLYKNDWVVVDEAQDTNVARRMMAERMLLPGGRALFCGDRNQAIYAFTGADAKAVDIIVENFQATCLPLTVTYRCSKAATQLAQSYVPQITAHDANNDGNVERLTASQVESRVAQRGFVKGDAVLCRNTKPLVKLCLQMLRNNIPSHVEGRDIGKSLLGVIEKWKVDTLKALFTNLENYRMRETKRLIESKSEYGIEALNDRVDTIIALSEDCDDVADLKRKIEGLFRDTESAEGRNLVTLSTIHKAKGREWERVYILGWDKYMPSRYAKQEWQQDAEANLAYVAVTRTKNELFLTEALD